jgi:hypothetical protein
MTVKIIHTEQAAKHCFRIIQDYFHQAREAFVADFRPLNPKTGKPWQASHRITRGADVQPGGFREPQAYSTLEAAQAAIAWKQTELAQRRR